MIKENTITQDELDLLFEDPKVAKTKMKGYKEILEMYNSYELKIPEKGNVVRGKYEGIQGDQFIFSVKGYKDYIRIDRKSSESKYLKNIEEGNEIDIIITNVNNNNFYITGSIAFLYETKAHDTLKSLKENDSVFAYIKSTNPAGYDVDIIHDSVILPGFMPNTLAGINKLHDQESIVGESMKVMIESFSDQEGTYIVSRKKYLQSLIPIEASKLEYNKIYTGNVTGTTPFGVFVEFNECLTGMIHKVNLNPLWQDKISEIIPGTEIDFYMKDLIKDKSGYKIILTQILRDNLWDSIKNGQVIEGKVKDIKPFGILVSLDEETIGLIHTSEVEKVNKEIKIGDKINVKVLSTDRNSRKIFLTIN